MSMSRWGAFSKRELEVIHIALSQLYGKTTDDIEEFVSSKLIDEIVMISNV